MSGLPQLQKASFGRVALAGLAAIVLSILANLAVRLAAFAVLPLPAEFPPLTPFPIALFTFGGVLAATAVYALVNRFSPNPVRLYRIIAAIALILSILPNFGLMANPAAAPFPGGSALAFGVLIIFHVVAAVISVIVLTSRAAPQSK